MSPYLANNDNETYEKRHAEGVKRLELECYGPHQDRKEVLIAFGFLFITWLLLYSMHWWLI